MFWPVPSPPLPPQAADAWLAKAAGGHRHQMAQGPKGLGGGCRLWLRRCKDCQGGQAEGLGPIQRLPFLTGIRMLPSCPFSPYRCPSTSFRALNAPQQVHSLDLVTTQPGVIACDMAQTPLEVKPKPFVTVSMQLLLRHVPCLLWHIPSTVSPLSLLLHLSFLLCLYYRSC